MEGVIWSLNSFVTDTQLVGPSNHEVLLRKIAAAFTVCDFPPDVGLRHLFGNTHGLPFSLMPPWVFPERDLTNR